MHHVDNDIDDLFGKAAAGYPLRVTDANWEAISMRLPVAVANAPVIKERKKFILPVSFLAAFMLCGLVLNKFEKWLPGENNKITSEETFANKLPAKKIIPGLHNKSSLVIQRVINVRPVFTRSSNDESRPARLQEPEGKDNREINIISLSGLNFRKPFERELSPSLPVKTTDPDNNKLENNKPGNHAVKKHFYIGFTAGAEINKVKDAHHPHAGYNAGLLAGYQLNKKISFETGLIYSYKNYFSKGEDFDMKKLVAAGMPGGMKMMHVEGKSALAEIPLIARYDFASNRSGSFFLSTGLSAYLVTVEKNKYMAIVNGTEERFNGVYKENVLYFPSVIDLSAGKVFEGKNFRLRIEPYVKIPVKGIGVGLLPVTSTGLRISITQ